MLFFFKQKTAYKISSCLINSEMCIFYIYLVMDSLPDVVVCVVLIVCGVWLVKGPHPAKKPDASKDVPEDADFCEYHADEPDNAALLSSPVVNENEVTDDGTEHDE